MLIIINSTIKYGIKKKYRKKELKLQIKFKESKARITYFSKIEQNKLEKYLTNNLTLQNLAILLDLYTGLRIGELCALQWSDIDFVNDTITVTKTTTRIKNNTIDKKNKTTLSISLPKTKYSIRVVPIPDFLSALLKSYSTNKNNFVFTNSNKPKDPRTLEKNFNKILIICGIRPLVFHSLRHTFATRACESGMDIKILSELLGHSTYKITLDIYVHTSLEFKKQSVNSLVKYLNTKKFVEQR